MLARLKPVSQDFVPCVHDPCFCSKLLYMGPKQYSTCNIGEETVKLMSLEDLDVDEQSGIDEKDSLKVDELGIALSELLHVHDFHGQLSDHDPSSDQNAICNSKGNDVCQELKILRSASLDANMNKGLNKSATFPCSGKMQLSPIDGSQGILTTSLHDRSCLESVNPVYARSKSLPATLRLVSAMKGGREQQGLPLKMKLNVKWAPDVYDPPATSMPHTMKSHQQRPKAKKKDHHKHKGKSSKWGAAEKHHSKRRSRS